MKNRKIKEEYSKDPKPMYPPKRKHHSIFFFLPVTALVLAFLLSASGSLAATKSALMHVSARVTAFVQVNLLSQKSAVQVTEVDIQRGYVDVPSASKIQVKTNSPYGFMVSFSADPNPFKETRITGLNTPVILSSGVTSILQPSVRGTTTLDLNYRFFIPQTLQPGSYPCPISVFVQTG